jgi:hypothetical protein
MPLSAVFSQNLSVSTEGRGSIDNLKLVRYFRLAFFDLAQSEPADQSQRRQTAGDVRCRLDRRRRHCLLAQGFRRNQTMRGFALAVGASEYWATSLLKMTEAERETEAKSAWRIEMYHRALKQQCLIERAQCRRLRPVLNHIGLCIRAFVRLESHCYREKISWIEAKACIIRDAVRAYLSKPRYLLLPTA